MENVVGEPGSLVGIPMLLSAQVLEYRQDRRRNAMSRQDSIDPIIPGPYRMPVIGGRTNLIQLFSNPFKSSGT